MPLSRRTALGATLAATLAPNWSPAAEPVPYTLPALPYDVAANEAAIDAETMGLHHDKHHAAYVANLNAALKPYPDLLGTPLPDLLRRVPELPEAIRTAVRNNAGGHANHSMFWTILGGRGAAPDGDLATAINRDLGGMDTLKAAFTKAGLSVFGSGWVFVTVAPTGGLALTTRPNQDTPLMDGQRVLLGNDVWEHAYYLRYRNRRADYLAAWWNVIDWTRVADRYQRARAGTLEV